MTINMRVTLGQVTVVVTEQNPHIIIGRDPSTCHIVSNDASVSRQHAQIYIDYGFLYLHDMGSSNGTWVNGIPLRESPVPIDPSQQIFVGQQQLFLEDLAVGGKKTMMVAQPEAIRAFIAGREAHMSAQGTAVPTYQQANPGQQTAAPFATGSVQSAVQQQPATRDAQLGLGGSEGGLPAEYTYRRQGSNSNGVLLIALKQDTFANDNVIDGFLEYTALDAETIASITIELVEYHKNGPSKGHVWDRMLVRQGPWKSKKNDVLPMPFNLRVPTGTAVTGRDVNWELRGYVDINWAFDVQATAPIMMKNVDMEQVRDALGTIDYRIVELEPLSLGQHYVGKFQPPAQLRKQLGVSNINLDIEYLGADLLIRMVVEKTSMFKFDKKAEFKFDLARLRTASIHELGKHFMDNINLLMK
ncbi:FHA domain-containing protein [Myxococcota bacterium]|nr:FHA domain-containing protein [Myxococcota bacterium]MBU1535174.1 FHA domain-containing protein [Myxococcota bacterium]